MLGIAAVTFTVILSGCGEPVPWPKPHTDPVQLLRWVEGADPVKDAARALKEKDFKLLAVYGYTWTIPGVAETDRCDYRERYGMKLIEGTSDALVNPEHGRLVELTIKYATTYNRHLVA